MKTRGIRQQYVVIFVISLLIIIFGLGSIYFTAKQSLAELKSEQEAVTEKAAIMDELADSIHNLFFHIRGYYAFQNDDELNEAYETIAAIQSLTKQFKMYELSAEEHELLSEVENFMIEYESNTLPKGINLVKTNDYEGLRQLANSGALLSVTGFIAYANDYNIAAKERLIDTFDHSREQINKSFLSMFMISLFFLAIPVYLIWRTTIQIIRPIEEMTAAADKYESDGDLHFQPIARNDEIGTLSYSITGMVKKIQSSEQEMLAQNEELISQQDELFNRQTKLEAALSEARYNRIRLERYNGLSRLISLSMDQQEIADESFKYFDSLYKLDLGFIWLPQSDTVVLKGISDSMFEDIRTNRMDYLNVRLETEEYFVIKREAEYERGIADSNTFVYDYIAAEKNNDNEIVLVAMFSRIGRSFSTEDQEDLYSLIKRIGLAIDRVEQYKQVFTERTMTQSILDNLNEGVRFVSIEDEEDKYNAALMELLGMYEHGENVHWTRDKFVDFFLTKIDDDGQYKAFIEKSSDPANYKIIESSYTLEGETPKIIHVYSAPVIIENEKVGTIFVHRDMTREYEIDQMKTELVSTVSHELRTPLSSILGFSELLLTREMDDNRKSRYLETIHSEAKRLTALINDFLDIQRMEAGRQSYETADFSIKEAAEQTVEAIAVHSPNHQISVRDFTCSSVIHADYDRIVQVFTNLLSNAVKFSPNGGAVKVTLWNEEDTSVTVSIQDEGIGIPKKEAGHMFEKFYRFDNTLSRKIGGTGLGLSICREIVKGHQGNIWIESEEHKGTTVYFTLPLKQALPSNVLYPDRPLIVIVEDDMNMALLLSDELTENGYAVVHHSDVHTAYSCISKASPATVVVDLMLPDGESGWDLIKMMKDSPATATIPIVISSALEQQPELTEQFQVEHYMTKPYPIQDLSNAVKESIQLKDGSILYPER